MQTFWRDDAVDLEVGEELDLVDAFEALLEVWLDKLDVLALRQNAQQLVVGKKVEASKNRSS